MNFVAIDWCFYPSDKGVVERNLIGFENHNIYQFEYLKGYDEMWGRYRETWFMFNEDTSYSNYLNKKLQ